jgi:hypothetical protein
MATAAPESCDLRGMDACLYFNVGDDDTEVWVEHIGLTGDLTCTETEDENELSTRNRNRVVKEYTEGDTDIAITGTQVMDPEYIGWQVLYSMRTNGAPYDVMFLTQPISDIGGVGWRGKMRNYDRTFNAPATGSQTQNFSLKPAACTDVSVRAVKVDAEDTPTDFDPTVVDTFPSTTTAAPTTTTT